MISIHSAQLGEHRQAMETALNYFRRAAPMHTADEEEDLFPEHRGPSDPVLPTQYRHVIFKEITRWQRQQLY